MIYYKKEKDDKEKDRREEKEKCDICGIDLQSNENTL